MAGQLKVVVCFLALSVLYISFNEAVGKPADDEVTTQAATGKSKVETGSEPEVDPQLSGPETNRTRRASCSKGGCHKGYCYAYCDLGWCYTTRGSTQSYVYVRCNHDNQCDDCWSCGGPCALF